MAAYKTGGDFSGSSFLREPGSYHLVINALDEIPTKRDGTPIDNAAFRANVMVLAGTTEGQEDKSTELTFFNPKATDKDGGAFRQKQMDRFLLAIGLISENDKDKEVEFDWQDAVGRQLVAKLELSQDGKYVQLSYADVFHVDDVAVKDVPKNQDALKLIPLEQRKIGNRAKPATAKPKAAAKRETVAATANGASDVDYSDV